MSIDSSINIQPDGTQLISEENICVMQVLLATHISAKHTCRSYFHMLYMIDLDVGEWG
jgi:hypothetical protein